MTVYNPEIHHRKSRRLRGYDYSRPGAYFVTICLDTIRCVLARMDKKQLRLTPIGEIAEKYWVEIPEHYPSVKLDEFVVMPDHVHGILKLRNAPIQTSVYINGNDSDVYNGHITGVRGGDVGGMQIVGARHGQNNDDHITVGARHGQNNDDHITVGARHGKNNDDDIIVGARHGVPLQQYDDNVPQCHGVPLRCGGQQQPRPQKNEYQHIIPNSLGIIINHFKSAVTRWCRKNNYPQFKWQRSFYDHIIRDDPTLYRIRQYIRNNPMQLTRGKEHLNEELGNCREKCLNQPFDTSIHSVRRSAQGKDIQD